MNLTELHNDLEESSRNLPGYTFYPGQKVVVKERTEYEPRGASNDIESFRKNFRGKIFMVTNVTKCPGDGYHFNGEPVAGDVLDITAESSDGYAVSFSIAEVSGGVVSPVRPLRKGDL